MKFFKALVLGTFVLLVVVVLALVVLGARPGARDVHGSIVIRRTPEQVWPWLVEPARVPKWVSGIAAVRLDSTTASGVGERQTWIPSGGGDEAQAQVLVTVTRNEPPHARDVHSRLAGFFDADVAYRLTPVPEGTRFEETSRFHYGPWIARLLQPAMMGAARATIAADLARLDSLVSAEGVAADSSAGR